MRITKTNLQPREFFAFCWASYACKYTACPISNHAVMSKWILNTEQKRRVCFLPVLQTSSPLAASALLIEAVSSNTIVKKDLLPHIGNKQICLEIRCCYLWLSPVEFKHSVLQSGNWAAIVFLTDTAAIAYSNYQWTGLSPQEWLQLLNISDTGSTLHDLIAVVRNHSSEFQSRCVFKMTLSYEGD